MVNRFRAIESSSYLIMARATSWISRRTATFGTARQSWPSPSTLARSQPLADTSIIGVREDGSPAGRLTRDAAALFDEATLRSKLAPQYLPETISLTTAVHDVEGVPVVIVYVTAHPNGFVVMQRDGDYEDAAGISKRHSVPETCMSGVGARAASGTTRRRKRPSIEP